MPDDIFPYAIVITFRLLGSLAILKKPFWGFLLALGLDIIDLEVLEWSDRLFSPGFAIDYAIYQVVDKFLDMYMLALALAASAKWPEKLAKRAAAALFFFRLLGVLLFAATLARIWLVLFLNLFEVFYIFYAYHMRYLPNYRIKTGKNLLSILIILGLLKLGHEFFLHIEQLGPWGRFKREILGWPE